ncbi:MAG: cyclase family protein [Desulfovibrionaceae bacterium]|nr:cyclase family protein [Desulfovibrionaceae bacterium]
MLVHDLTHSLAPEISLYPGTPQPSFQPLASIERDGFRETSFWLTSHMGTHMDAPAHLLPEGTCLDDIPPERFCGSAFVADCSALKPGKNLSLPLLKAAYQEPLDFLLVHTGWDCFWGQPAYLKDYPTLEPEAAEWLAGLGLKGVGLDTISPDPLDSSTLPAHRLLLGAGTLLIENLCNLGPLCGRRLFFAALPLPLARADGAQVRAVAIKQGLCSM